MLANVTPHGKQSNVTYSHVVALARIRGQFSSAFYRHPVLLESAEQARCRPGEMWSCTGFFGRLVSVVAAFFEVKRLLVTARPAPPSSLPGLCSCGRTAYWRGGGPSEQRHNCLSISAAPAQQPWEPTFPVSIVFVLGSSRTSDRPACKRRHSVACVSHSCACPRCPLSLLLHPPHELDLI